MDNKSELKSLIEDAVFKSLMLEKLDGHTRDNEKMAIQVALLDKKIDHINESKFPSILQEIAALKVKSSLWGGLAGLVVSIISIIAALMSLK